MIGLVSNVSCATPINLHLEQSLYVTTSLRGIIYGLEIFTFFAAVYCISHRSDGYRKGQKFYIAIGGTLLALVTIDVALISLWGQYMWIDQRNYPGGPTAYYVASEAAWYSVMHLATCVLANILGDGLLVYRCFIIWGLRWRIQVIVFLSLIYLASSVISVITLVEYAMPGTILLAGNPIHLVVPWVSLSVGLNVIVTSIICFRLLRMRGLMREVLSPEMSSMYTSVAAMLIESAAPFSILGVCLVFTAVLKVELVPAFGNVWTMFCSLSPLMIILRVAMGRGWLKKTVKELNTALVFAQPTTAHEQSQGVRVTIHNTVGTISGPGTPAGSSDMSVEKHMSAADVVSIV